MTAPTPDAKALLYPDWNLNPVEFNKNLSYRCERGRKFDLDFDKTEENVTCMAGNEWDKPDDNTWPICVESKLNNVFLG